MTTESARIPTVRASRDCEGKVSYRAFIPDGTKMVPLTDAVPDGIDSISATYETSSNNLQCYQITYRTGKKPYTFDLCEMEFYPFYLQIPEGVEDENMQYPFQKDACEWVRQNVGYYDRPYPYND